MTGSRSAQLGERQNLSLSQGTIHYRVCGEGPTLLFVHGLWVNGDLWREVVPLLAHRYHCVTPDWPFGAHAEALAPSADLSPQAVGDLIAEFIDALGLTDVTVVANDTGVAYAQLFVARHPAKLSRLVLTPGDVTWNFLPVGIKWMRLVAWIPGAMLPLAQFWNSRAGRLAIMLPLTRRMPPRDVLDSWFEPATRDAGIRRDLAKLLRSATPRATISAIGQLDNFKGRSLVVWPPTGNVVFPLRHGRRLVQALAHAELIPIPQSRAFVPEDQPERLASMIDELVSEPSAQADRHAPSQAR